MSRNGAGVYTLYPGVNPVVSGTTISSTWANNTLNDLATAMSGSIAADGQTPITGNLQMSTFRHTGVGNAVARTDYSSAGQIQDGTLVWCGTAGGTADAITLTPTPAITAVVAGMSFRFKAGASPNTGPMTVAISGLTAIAIQNNGAACAAGAVAASKWYQITVDATTTACQLSKIGAPTFGEIGSGPITCTTINASGLITAAAGITITGGAAGAGHHYYDVTFGSVQQCIAGATYDFMLVEPAGVNAIMRVPTGTNDMVFNGSVTGNSFSGAGTGLTGTAASLTAGHVTTNANLTGGVTSVGNAATVVTNANLTGDVTSVGNATTLTNAPVIAKVLTGYTSTTGTVAATDTILSAIQKLNGNTNALSAISQQNTTTNGAMRVSQIYEGAAFTNDAAINYIVDRWFQLGSVTSKFSGQQVADAPAGLVYSAKFTVIAQYSPGATELFQFTHRIAGNRIAKFGFGTAAAQTITVFGWVKASVAGNYSTSLRNAAANRSYPFTIAATTGWTQWSTTLTADITGTWVTDNTSALLLTCVLGAGANFLSTANSWQAGNFASVTGNLQFVNQINGSTIQFSGIDIIAGSTVPTAYQAMDYELEINECKKFIRKSFPQGTAPAQSAGLTGAYVFTATKAGAVAVLSPAFGLGDGMNGAPTMTYYNPSAGNAFARDVTAGADCTVTATNRSGDSNFSITATPTAAGAVGNELAFHWLAMNNL